MYGCNVRINSCINHTVVHTPAVVACALAVISQWSEINDRPIAEPVATFFNVHYHGLEHDRSGWALATVLTGVSEWRIYVCTKHPPKCPIKAIGALHSVGNGGRQMKQNELQFETILVCLRVQWKMKKSETKLKSVYGIRGTRKLQRFLSV